MGNLIFYWFKAMFRWFCWVLTIPLLLVALILTPLGAKIGFIILSRTVPGELHYQQVMGGLLGPLSIKQFSYRYQDRRIAFSRLYLEWSPEALFAGKFLIDKFIVNDLQIDIPQAPAPTPHFSAHELKQTLQKIHQQLTRTYLPVNLQIDAAHFNHIIWRSHPGPPSVDATNINIQHLRLTEKRLGGKLQGQLIQPYPIQIMLSVNGQPQDYHFNLSAYNPATQWVVNGHVKPETVDLNTEKALIFGGELQTHLIWRWAEPMSWQLTLSAKKLDLSVLKPDLPHPLDITLSSSGDLGDARPHFLWNAILKTPKTRIETQGQYLNQWDIIWNVQIAELAELLPFSSGVINSIGELHGSLLKPQTNGFLQASLLRWQDYRADKVNAKWNVDISEAHNSYFQFTAEQLFSHSIEIPKLQLSGDGKWAKHVLNAHIQAYQSDLSLSVAGGFSDDHWQGSAQKLNFFTSSIGAWTLSQPTALYISPQRAEVSALCLQSALKTQACLVGSWKRADNSWRAALTSKLNLNQITGILPPEVSANIPVDFHLKAEGAGSQIAQAQLTADSPGGNFRYNGKPVVDTPVKGAKLTAKLDAGGAGMDMKIEFADNNIIRANLALPKASFATLLAKNQELRGELFIDINNLSPIQAFIPEMVNPQGTFHTRMQIAGTVGDPAISGNATLDAGEIKIPGLNIQLKQLHLALSAKGRSELNYILSATSADQPVQAVGHTLLNGTNFPTEITLSGENLLLLDNPQYTVRVTPNIHFALKGREVNITGNVAIPNATIHQLEFQKDTSLPEDEVVFIGGHVVEATKPWKVNTQLNISLGDNVKVDSPGLKAKLKGNLTIISAPNQVMLGEGRIDIVDGAYEVYNRKLTITPGSAIIYRKTPLSNPGLSVQAITQVIVTDPLSQQQLGTNELTVGMNIGGSSSTPQITLFSSAGNMSQADMLAFLLLGTSSAGISPLNMNLMLQALNSLPLTKKGAGNVQGITDQVKQGLGLSELGVESEPTLGPTGEAIQTKATPTSYFVVGKRLTSRIYFRYKYDPFDAVNLFQLSYLFSRNWSLQLETDGNTQSGADILYTIQTGTSQSFNKSPPPLPSQKK